VDVVFDPSRLVVEGVIPSQKLGMFAGGLVDQGGGVVGALGGCAPLGDDALGADSTWVRVAALELHGRQPGLAGVQTGPSAGGYGVSIMNRLGILDSSEVHFGSGRFTMLDDPAAAREPTSGH
jgi:hypothetical protein